MKGEIVAIDEFEAMKGNMQAAERQDVIRARIMNFFRTTQPNRPGKHRASGPGFIHSIRVLPARKRKGDGLTNHERVVASRANRMGLSIEEYKRKFSAA